MTYSSPRTYLAAALSMVNPTTQDWADRDDNSFNLLKLADEYHASGIKVYVFAHMLNVAAMLGR